jgi:hypothetical protein
MLGPKIETEGKMGVLYHAEEKLKARDSRMGIRGP